MIKIIKPGKIKHEDWCTECDCHFEFEAEDVTIRTVWDDHGGHYPVCDFYEIKCPYCNYVLKLDDDDFTDDEKKMMKKIDD